MTKMPLRILVSAGEASGDTYAAEMVTHLRRHFPDAEFFGCTGPQMRDAGVATVIDSASLAVVGLVEVVRHLPRIYSEFTKLIDYCQHHRPDLAILTDSPDFHLRVAKKMKGLGVPVAYLVAPQVWAWRKDRLPGMKRTLDQLFCIFPFEEAFFRGHGINAHYIGHPLTRLVKTSVPREDFCLTHGLDPAVPIVTLLPGSRLGETARHLPVLLEAADLIATRYDCQLVWATPRGFFHRPGAELLRDATKNRKARISLIEGDTWNAIGHARLALPASGTVTVETAILGIPMVTYYRVTGLSWLLGKLLLDVPFYSMPNLIARRAVIPELMQERMTAPALAESALRLLTDEEARRTMIDDLASVVDQLQTSWPPMEVAADRIATGLLGERIC